MTFKRTPHRGQLIITDNGRGFVIDKVTPEHLGLTIMNERAEAIGARLEIESRLGQGTTVTVAWREPHIIAAASRPILPSAKSLSRDSGVSQSSRIVALLAERPPSGNKVKGPNATRGARCFAAQHDY